MTYECVDWPIHKIAMKIDVKVTNPPSNWYQLGGVKEEKEELNDDGKTFFVKKWYEEENSTPKSYFRRTPNGDSYVSVTSHHTLDSKT